MNIIGEWITHYIYSSYVKFQGIYFVFLKIPENVAYTAKLCRHMTTKILTRFSSEENDDKCLSVDDMFVICDARFVT